MSLISLRNLLGGLILRQAWDNRGVSAVEFSLLAPFLVVGAFSTVDAGMAVYDKMVMSQVLRSGAQAAIGSDDVDDVLAILRATASQNFTVAAGTPAAGELAVDVTQYCVCPEAMGARVACTATCSDGGAPHRFYELSATRLFSGVMLPEFSLSGEISVIAQ